MVQNALLEKLNELVEGGKEIQDLGSQFLLNASIK